MIIVKKPKLLPLFILFFISSFLFAQDNITLHDRISPPAEGKTVIYILRTSGLGMIMNFRFFEKSKYLGKFNGVNYIRYECEPGEKVFWVKAENIDFIEADLSRDKIYFVEANAVMGAFSAGVKFRIVDYSNKRQMKRIKNLLDNKEVKVFNNEKLIEDEKKMKDIIQRGMLKVQNKLKKGKKIKRITSNMNYKI